MSHKDGELLEEKNRSIFYIVIHLGVKDPVVTVALTDFFYRTVPSKIQISFSLNFYLKTDGTSLLILFFT